MKPEGKVRTKKPREKENESSKFQLQCLVKFNFSVPKCFSVNTGKYISSLATLC